MIIDARSIVFVTLTLCCVVAHDSVKSDDYPKDFNGKKSAGSMLAEIAKELIQRSTSSSQVLNLNLSNLLLLLVLKAVVFGANYFGHHRHKGRDLNEEDVVSEGEVTLAMGYLIGDTCLYKAACEEPRVATEYLGAAEMILETMKLLPHILPMESKYEKTIMEFRKAIEYGANDRCPPEYDCKKENIKNIFGMKDDN